MELKLKCKHVFKVQLILLSVLFSEFSIQHLEIMIRYNMAATSIILTPCIVHNSKSDSIKKHNMTASLKLTSYIVHHSIQSGSIHKP